LENNEKLEGLADVELKKIVEAFMESMKQSIREIDYKHTGVPLVTRLVAEYLEDKVPQVNSATLNKTVKDLMSEKFNLWSLYENFISKSFNIYFKEKRGMDMKNAINRGIINREIKKIMENYKIYAIQQFLKKDADKFFLNLANKKFSDDEIEEMAKVGLIYKTDDGYKFVHQTFAEHLFTLHLMENFEQLETAEFIVHSVFIENQFQVVRSFVEHWINSKMALKVYKIYYDLFVLEDPSKNTTSIRVCMKEQNSNFNFGYGIY
jgi:hypothetical protein